MNGMRVHRFSSGLAALLVLAALAPAQAVAQSYQVEAIAIHASKTNSKVSPELRGLLPKLKQVYPQYKGFTIEKRAAGKVSQGATFTGRLVHNYAAKLTPQKRAGSKIQLNVLITVREARGEKNLVRTTLTLSAGGMNFPGNFKYPGNPSDLLIIGVRAR